jgi:hypothetical protein
MACVNSQPLARFNFWKGFIMEENNETKHEIDIIIHKGAKLNMVINLTRNFGQEKSDAT